jgi:demethylmenaquinone methyltransferase/2-methoxy-6-polyprenyl-1,4-benzoquinol methylase
MNLEASNKRAEDVRRMFTRIANRYDLLNRLMTLGQDRHWRRDTIALLHLKDGDRLLDIGTGTGDLAIEAAHQHGEINIVACDFTAAMIRHGQDRNDNQPIQWVIADAHALPFASNQFNGVVSGFLLRNVINLEGALQEQNRVLMASGRLACLDTTPPRPGLLNPLLDLHFKWIIPTLGRWIAGDEQAYRYLPETTQAFISAPALARILTACGFEGVGFVLRMLGTIAIHWAVKPLEQEHATSLGRGGYDSVQG